MSITVQTEPMHSNQPVNHHDNIAHNFIEVLFGMDFDEFAIKYEAYALFHIKGEFFHLFYCALAVVGAQITTGVPKNSNDRKTMTKHIMCAVVWRGLHK